MKKIPFLIILVFLAFSCKPDLNNPLKEKDRSIGKSTSSDLPVYTQPDYQRLVESKDDEDLVIAKTELIAFSIGHVLGNFGSWETTEGLVTGLPCGEDFVSSSWEILKPVTTFTNPEDLLLQLGKALATRISGYNPTNPNDYKNLWVELSKSLIIEGAMLNVKVKTPEKVSENSSTHEGFIGFYSYAMEGQIYIAGFNFKVGFGIVSKEINHSLTNNDPQNPILLVYEDGGGGVERFNDPCHYTGPGTGGGGATEYDDDGNPIYHKTGALLDGNPCNPNPDYIIPGQLFIHNGIRLVKFHLADRNEGGAFSGKSEVVLIASVWKTLDPIGTMKTGTNGDFKNVSCPPPLGGFVDLPTGALIAQVPKASVTTSNSDVIDINSQHSINLDNWVILPQGFCSIPDDKLWICFSERDPSQLRSKPNPVLPQIISGCASPYDHWYIATLASDDWIDITLDI